MATAIESPTVTGLGPVRNAITLPVQPGMITEVIGANGTGKSTIEKAIDRLAGGDATVTVTDGEKSGSLEWGEVALKVARSVRRSGDMEIVSLQGRFDLATLVHPGLKDAEAGDLRAIKSIVAISGAELTADDFADLAGGREQLELLCRPETLAIDDPVALAAAIKRDLEAAARTSADRAEAAERRAAGLAAANEGIDLDGPADEAELEAAKNDALVRASQLIERRRVGLRQWKASETARAALERAKAAAADQPTAAELRAAVESADAATEVAEQEVERLQVALERATEQLSEWCRKRRSLESQAQDAERHEALIAEYEQTLAATTAVEIPTADEIGEAEQAVEMARQRVLEGVRIRDARKRDAEARKLAAEKSEHESRANRLRQAAHGTDEVLSDVISRLDTPLRVIVAGGAARLAIDPERGAEYVRSGKDGSTLYAELSDGQRTEIALELAVSILSRLPSERRVLTISQRMWQDLDHGHRQRIAGRLCGTDIVAFAFRCSQDGDPEQLHARLYRLEA